VRTKIGKGEHNPSFMKLTPMCYSCSKRCAHLKERVEVPTSNGRAHALEIHILEGKFAPVSPWCHLRNESILTVSGSSESVLDQST
jgi:hypothetical protein